MTKEGKEVFYYGCGIKEEGHCPHCDEAKPDAECICGGHSFIIKGELLTKCPVCNAPLKKIEEKYLPVYEEGVISMPQEVGSVISRVKLSRERLGLVGIKTTKATKHPLTKEIRTVGKVAFDPELTVAQEEFLTALQTKEKLKDSPDPDVIERADNLVEKSTFKLRLLGMSDEEIGDLKRQGSAQLNLVLPEKKAWVYADVYEFELGWVNIGQEVLITTTAYPGEEFKGKVKSISPLLNPMTRSAKIRIETDNPKQKLKPQMYVDVIIESMYTGVEGSPEALAVPKDAVLDTGARKIVYVERGEGEFLGREIRVGPETVAIVDGQRVKMYPVLSGLSEGETVVTKGNFLLDSQSQITGAAAAAYGGAIGKEEKEMPPEHKH